MGAFGVNPIGSRGINVPSRKFLPLQASPGLVDGWLRPRIQDPAIGEVAWYLARRVGRRALRNAIDEIMERLRADGTVERIYRRYGVILQSPK